MDHLSTHTRTSPFPPDAAAWLAGQSGRTVVLVGDPVCTAPLASALHALGYDVRCSIDGTMSLPDRSVDGIVALETAPDLETAARVLRPGGQVALLVQEHDVRIPWARKLRAALRLPAAREPGAAAATLGGSPYFGVVEVESFRHWEVVTRDGLDELVRSLPAVWARSASETDKAVAAATELYDDYGRGPDGMQLPWISHCCRVPVLSQAWAMVTERARAAADLAQAEEAAARAAAQAIPDPADPADPDDPADPAGQHRDASRAGATNASEAPAPPPRAGFDIGDTAEGIITYVVDTGELPAVRAPLRDAPSAGRGAGRVTSDAAPDPSPASGASGASAASAASDEPDDPDLLIRFH